MTGRTGWPPRGVKLVPWSRWWPEWPWLQGEHVTLLGPTGSGKTTLMLQLQDRRSHVVVLANKAADATMDKLAATGDWVVTPTWPPKGHTSRNPPDKIIVWPELDALGDAAAKQADVFAATLQGVFREGGWCVMFDEVRYLTETLGLRKEVTLLLLQGRSLGVSIVAGTQRPAYIPLEFYDQASWVFSWRDNDDVNLKRLGGLGAADPAILRRTVAGLPRWHVAVTDTRTGRIVVTRPPRTL